MPFSHWGRSSNPLVTPAPVTWGITDALHPVSCKDTKLYNMLEVCNSPGMTDHQPKPCKQVIHSVATFKYHPVRFSVLEPRSLNTFMEEGVHLEA